VSVLDLAGILIAAVLGATVTVAVLRARRTRGAPTATSARRILFPFLGESLSEPALDAAIRLAKAEGATLVPAFLARVPKDLPLDGPLPRQCGSAIPILEAIEQRATKSGVAVDSRIERGRTYRHALHELIDHERYDRIVAPAAANGTDGFSADDVAWLLDHATGDIVVFRAGQPLERSAQPASMSGPEKGGGPNLSSMRYGMPEVQGR
jgi:nucleotide-binding universal stress UspA family protein